MTSLILAGAIWFAVAALVLAMVLAMLRLAVGPTAQDRVLALDSLYINAMLLVLVAGIRQGNDLYFDAAMLIALFGFVGSTALSKFLLRGEVIEP